MNTKTIKSFFIVIEGLDGTGKSSAIRRIARILNASEGLPGSVKLTFEPHDPSACGVYIRQVLMRRIKAPLHTLALAFAVNRADHCLRDIVPFLEQANGRCRVVICDRYYLSSLVYQSDDSFPMARVMKLNESAVKPDLTIFLDASDRTCYARMRKRDQSKELFETNLRLTRRKYMEAIDYLVGTGERIRVVSAEGSPSDVCSRILEAIRQDAPEWLASKLQPHLFIDEHPEHFIETGISLGNAAKELRRIWNNGPLEDERDLSTRLEKINEATNSFVSGLGLNDLSNLFLDLVREHGYSIVDKIQWLDVDAVELAVVLPLGITQHGAAFLIGDTQRYDAILPNILGDDKIEALRSMSDFLLIFDSNPASLHSKYYEREPLEHKIGRGISPSIAVFGRVNISWAIVLHALHELSDEYAQSINCMPDAKALFTQWLENAASGQMPSPVPT